MLPNISRSIDETNNETWSISEYDQLLNMSMEIFFFKNYVEGRETSSRTLFRFLKMLNKR